MLHLGMEDQIANRDRPVLCKVLDADLTENFWSANDIRRVRKRSSILKQRSSSQYNVSENIEEEKQKNAKPVRRVSWAKTYQVLEFRPEFHGEENTENGDADAPTLCEDQTVQDYEKGLTQESCVLGATQLHDSSTASTLPGTLGMCITEDKENIEVTGHAVLPAGSMPRTSFESRVVKGDISVLNRSGDANTTVIDQSTFIRSILNPSKIKIDNFDPQKICGEFKENRSSLDVHQPFVIARDDHMGAVLGSVPPRDSDYDANKFSATVSNDFVDSENIPLKVHGSHSLTRLIPSDMDLTCASPVATHFQAFREERRYLTVPMSATPSTDESTFQQLPGCESDDSRMEMTCGPLDRSFSMNKAANEGIIDVLPDEGLSNIRHEHDADDDADHDDFDILEVPEKDWNSGEAIDLTVAVPLEHKVKSDGLAEHQKEAVNMSYGNHICQPHVFAYSDENAETQCPIYYGSSECTEKLSFGSQEPLNLQVHHRVALSHGNSNTESAGLCQTTLVENRTVPLMTGTLTCTLSDKSMEFTCVNVQRTISHPSNITVCGKATDVTTYSTANMDVTCAVNSTEAACERSAQIPVPIDENFTQFECPMDMTCCNAEDNASSRSSLQSVHIHGSAKPQLSGSEKSHVTRVFPPRVISGQDHEISSSAREVQLLTVQDAEDTTGLPEPEKPWLNTEVLSSDCHMTYNTIQNSSMLLNKVDKMNITELSEQDVLVTGADSLDINTHALNSDTFAPVTVSTKKEHKASHFSEDQPGAEIFGTEYIAPEGIEKNGIREVSITTRCEEDMEETGVVSADFSVNTAVYADNININNAVSADVIGTAKTDAFKPITVSLEEEKVSHLPEHEPVTGKSGTEFCTEHFSPEEGMTCIPSRNSSRFLNRMDERNITNHHVEDMEVTRIFSADANTAESVDISINTAEITASKPIAVSSENENKASCFPEDKRGSEKPDIKLCVEHSESEDDAIHYSTINSNKVQQNLNRTCNMNITTWHDEDMEVTGVVGADINVSIAEVDAFRAMTIIRKKANEACPFPEDTSGAGTSDTKFCSKNLSPKDDETCKLVESSTEAQQNLNGMGEMNITTRCEEDMEVTGVVSTNINVNTSETGTCKHVVVFSHEKENKVSCLPEGKSGGGTSNAGFHMKHFDDSLTHSYAKISDRLLNQKNNMNITMQCEEDMDMTRAVTEDTCTAENDSSLTVHHRKENEGGCLPDGIPGTETSVSMSYMERFPLENGADCSFVKNSNIFLSQTGKLGTEQYEKDGIKRTISPELYTCTSADNVFTPIAVSQEEQHKDSHLHEGENVKRGFSTNFGPEYFAREGSSRVQIDSRSTVRAIVSSNVRGSESTDKEIRRFVSRVDVPNSGEAAVQGICVKKSDNPDASYRSSVFDDNVNCSPPKIPRIANAGVSVSEGLAATSLGYCTVTRSHSTEGVTTTHSTEGKAIQSLPHDKLICVIKPAAHVAREATPCKKPLENSEQQLCKDRTNAEFQNDLVNASSTKKVMHCNPVALPTPSSAHRIRPLFPSISSPLQSTVNSAFRAFVSRTKMMSPKVDIIYKLKQEKMKLGRNSASKSTMKQCLQSAEIRRSITFQDSSAFSPVKSLTVKEKESYSALRAKSDGVAALGSSKTSNTAVSAATHCDKSLTSSQWSRASLLNVSKLLNSDFKEDTNNESLQLLHQSHLEGSLFGESQISSLLRREITGQNRSLCSASSFLQKSASTSEGKELCIPPPPSSKVYREKESSNSCTSSESRLSPLKADICISSSDKRCVIRREIAGQGKSLCSAVPFLQNSTSVSKDKALFSLQPSDLVYKELTSSNTDKVCFPESGNKLIPSKAEMCVSNPDRHCTVRREMTGQNEKSCVATSSASALDERELPVQQSLFGQNERSCVATLFLQQKSASALDERELPVQQSSFGQNEKSCVATSFLQQKSASALDERELSVQQSSFRQKEKSFVATSFLQPKSASALDERELPVQQSLFGQNERSCVATSFPQQKSASALDERELPVQQSSFGQNEKSCVATSFLQQKSASALDERELSVQQSSFGQKEKSFVATSFLQPKSASALDERELPVQQSLFGQNERSCVATSFLQQKSASALDERELSVQQSSFRQKEKSFVATSFLQPKSASALDERELSVQQSSFGQKEKSFVATSFLQPKSASALDERELPVQQSLFGQNERSCVATSFLQQKSASALGERELSVQQSSFRQKEKSFVATSFLQPKSASVLDERELPVQQSSSNQVHEETSEHTDETGFSAPGDQANSSESANCASCPDEHGTVKRKIAVQNKSLCEAVSLLQTASVMDDKQVPSIQSPVSNIQKVSESANTEHPGDQEPILSVLDISAPSPDEDYVNIRQKSKSEASDKLHTTYETGQKAHSRSSVQIIAKCSESDSWHRESMNAVHCDAIPNSHLCVPEVEQHNSVMQVDVSDAQPVKGTKVSAVLKESGLQEPFCISEACGKTAEVATSNVCCQNETISVIESKTSADQSKPASHDDYQERPLTSCSTSSIEACKPQESPEVMEIDNAASSQTENASGIEVVLKDVLEASHQKNVKWKIREMNETCVVFAFLWNTLLVNVFLDDTDIQERHQRKKFLRNISSISFISWFSDSAHKAAKVSHKLFHEALGSSDLVHDYPDTSYLLKMLEKMSAAARIAENFIMDVECISVRHDISIDAEDRLVVPMTSLSLNCKLLLSFESSLESYTSQKNALPFKTVLGTTVSEDLIQQAITHVHPGTNYYSRMVRAIERFQPMSLQ